MRKIVSASFLNGSSWSYPTATNVTIDVHISFDISLLGVKQIHSEHLADLLKICTQLFGNTENLERMQESILLGVTYAPISTNLGM
jgi:hypothetical protein